MNLFLDRHQELLKKLLQHKVEFIIIGGYSVIFHGYLRTTGDIDIWLKPDNYNKDKLIQLLEELTFDSNDIHRIRNLDFTKAQLIQIWEEPERVDFLTQINLVKYEDADNLKIIANFEGLRVPFLHLNHLILSKINTGRAKDKADIEELQQIHNKKP